MWQLRSQALLAQRLIFYFPTLHEAWVHPLRKALGMHCALVKLNRMIHFCDSPVLCWSPRLGASWPFARLNTRALFIYMILTCEGSNGQVSMGSRRAQALTTTDALMERIRFFTAQCLRRRKAVPSEHKNSATSVVSSSTCSVLNSDVVVWDTRV